MLFGNTPIFPKWRSVSVIAFPSAEVGANDFLSAAIAFPHAFLLRCQCQAGRPFQADR